MYKAKLQELCHQKKFALPKYSCLKDGPDHNPQFKASVIVNRINFDSKTICKSSKEAYNEAAKLAFIHFTFGTNQASDQEEAVQSPEVHSNTSSTKHDTPHGYKLKLQIYAQRYKLGLPIYQYETKGLPHELRYKATVTVAGKSFESPELFNNLVDAETAAAQTALLSLSTDAFQGNNESLYKNLLQQLAQTEGLFLPTYKTIGSGDPHDRTFISTVEVEGEMFNGKAAKSKKQAELNAAMAAYTALTERKSSETGESFHTSSDGNIVSASDPQGNAKPVYSSASTSVIRYESRVKESKGEEDEIDSTDASLKQLSFTPKENESSSAMTTLPDLSTLLISDSSKKNAKENNSYLLCNRVRVYTCIPDIALPEGTVLLQIAENKWVAVSLEFNN